MVSVNFRKNSPPPVYNPPSAAEIAARTKPSAIIDITLEDEPPQVIEKTEEIVDIYSEDEDGGGAKKKSNGGVEGVGTNDVTTVSSGMATNAIFLNLSPMKVCLRTKRKSASFLCVVEPAFVQDIA